MNVLLEAIVGVYAAAAMNNKGVDNEEREKMLDIITNILKKMFVNDKDVEISCIKHGPINSLGFIMIKSKSILFDERLDVLKRISEIASYTNIENNCGVIEMEFGFSGMSKRGE